MNKSMARSPQRSREAHLTARRKSGTKVGTANRDLVALKSALSLALKWDLIDVHPLAKVKPAKDKHSGVVRYLGSVDDGEEQRLRNALVTRDSNAIEARARTIAGGRAQHADVQPLPADGFADHLTPMALVAMNTGLRRGELTSLTWGTWTSSASGDDPGRLSRSRAPRAMFH
ncbi:MAG: hypothetical protein IPO66_16230 [Rhodanobacteraceae bacterium]|nr:hypothetical protein [Rhodanobacteraceae bacterium]